MWCTIKLRVGMCPTWLGDIKNCSAYHVSSFFDNIILMVIKKNKRKYFNVFLSICKTNYWKFYIFGLVVSNWTFRLFFFLNGAKWRHIRSTCSASAHAHVCLCTCIELHVHYTSEPAAWFFIKYSTKSVPPEPILYIILFQFPTISNMAHM